MRSKSCERAEVASFTVFCGTTFLTLLMLDLVCIDGSEASTLLAEIESGLGAHNCNTASRWRGIADAVAEADGLNVWSPKS